MTILPELRTAADNVVIGANHLGSLLRNDCLPPATPTAEAVKHYGPTSEKLQVWMAWRAIVLFSPLWMFHVEQLMPAQGERARTMEG